MTWLQTAPVFTNADWLMSWWINVLKTETIKPLQLNMVEKWLPVLVVSLRVE